MSGSAKPGAHDPSISAPPIEDFDLDSPGSLSSVDSAFDSLSDCVELADEPADAQPPESPATSQQPVVEPVKAPDPASVCSPPAKRKRGRPRKPTNAGPDIVTTGAFMTRATLRKLGVADVLAGPDTADSEFSVGSKVKVLSLDKHWYTAVVLAISAGKALVHYPSWDHGFNEWILIESRRLVFKGKELPDVSGSLEAMEQLMSYDPSVDDPELAEFDLARAIKDAFQASPDDDHMDIDDSVIAAVESDPPVNSDGSEAFAESKKLRGRPKGSQNRRRVGHIKSRGRRARKSAVAKAAVGDEEPSSRGEQLEIAAEEPVAVNLEAPPIPEELRIAQVRIQTADNPYARRHRPEDIFGGESEDDNAGSMGGSASTSRARASQSAGAQKAPTGHIDASGKASSDDAIWHLTRGSYVTTGAFLTRRTIKSLAHSGSTGGIMQDHHGYYPGQPVEVMNANRSWYAGRVISYANKKFLIHYNGYDHGHSEWIAAGSKRMRAASDGQVGAESEEDARKLCVVLVDEYNAHIDESERKKAEKAEAKRKVKQLRQTPVNLQIAKLTGKAMAQTLKHTGAGDNSCKGYADVDVGEDETDEDVEPITIDSGYLAIPQLLRVKDYVKLFHKGMHIAARDRNKLWWRAEIVGIKTFRLRVHYTGFSSSWDEWMEMNTQRIMLEEHSPLPDESHGSTPDDTNASRVATSDIGNTGQDQHGDSDGKDSLGTSHADCDSGRQRQAGSIDSQAPKRLGRPPGPETKSTPLSLRLALKALMDDRDMYEQCHPGELDVFHLPKEHMSMKDYSTFLKVGDRVRIRDRDKQWYECTIIDFRHGRIRVCFNGQSDEFNQWIPVNSERIR
ncbi:hypothetical protein H4S01_004232, partial [Coemansia sp. RSA 2610]